jgi:hypothetical protein
MAAVSSQAAAEQKAISCSLKTVEEHTVFADRKEPVTQQTQQVAMYILDDEKQSIAKYNPASKALQGMCEKPECSIEYSSSEIGWSETQTRPIIKMQEFRLNRNDGTFYMFVGLGTNSEATSFKTTGACNATEMPELTTPEAKF